MDTAELVALATEKARRDKHQKLYRYQPYGFQKLLHAASKDNSQIVLMAANRVGKSYAAAREIAYHLTGQYPDWWKGRTFDRPVRVWVAGSTNEKVRDIMQAELLGDSKNPGAFGTAAIPGDLVVSTTRKPGIPNALSGAAVRHATGGNSVVAFKPYEAGTDAFMGESVDIVLLDEEPPQGIYSQCLVRVLDRSGYVLLTFTPENGMTNLVAEFTEKLQPGQTIITATWDDAKHLDESAKAQILAAIPEYEREMRSRGVPRLGSGRVFPTPEDQLRCKKFDIPDYFHRIGGLDFGMDHPTACVDCALDRDAGVFYVVSCYRKRNLTLPRYAQEIREFIGTTNVAWPHDGGRRDPGSGEGLADLYRRAGIRMLPQCFTNPPAPGQEEGHGGNASEPGIQALVIAMESGKFKVMDTPENEMFFQEYRMYHRKDGEIIALRDDLMSAVRYAYQSRRFARTRLPPKQPASYLDTQPIYGT